ncbi:MAG: hypothetical protein IJG47_14455 [Microbacterium sp.]|nr:hypothetical protein [Microbacterium sp.]
MPIDSLVELDTSIRDKFRARAVRQPSASEDVLTYVLYEEFSFSFVLSDRRRNIGAFHNLPGARQQTVFNERIAFNGRDAASVESMLERIDRYCRSHLPIAALEYFDGRI